MTESIKQWIADQALAIATSQGFSGSNVVNIKSQLGAIQGLTKGIEIAEGFAEWVEEVYAHEGEGKWYDVRKIKDDSNPVEFLTTSQLLEKYLETLNKEK